VESNESFAYILKTISAVRRHSSRWKINQLSCETLPQHTLYPGWLLASTYCHGLNFEVN
jgi:hypothetical protein